jgi:hypothetical protein
MINNQRIIKLKINLKIKNQESQKSNLKNQSKNNKKVLFNIFIIFRLNYPTLTCSLTSSLVDILLLSIKGRLYPSLNTV